MAGALALLLALAHPHVVQNAPPDLRTHYLVLLTKGPAWTSEMTPEAQQLQQAHAERLLALVTSGRLLASGPIGDAGDLRAVLMLRAASIDDARALLGDDPAIKAGRLKGEVLAFYMASSAFVFNAPREDAPMRRFIVGLLQTTSGPQGTKDNLARLDTAHTAHLAKLRATGTLVMSGTFDDAGSRRALVVFASDNLAAIRALVDDDPWVTSGACTVELHPWFTLDGVMAAAKIGS